MLNEAKQLSALGWHLFPVKGKIPAINGWQQLATNNHQKLDLLFKTPHTGIGLATGKVSGVTVIDVDNKNGVNGFLTLERMGIELPTTVTSLTGGGGKQFFFNYCPLIMKNVIGAFGPKSGIDIKNDGGLVVLPPSIHPNGKPYEWFIDQSPSEMSLANLPENFLAILATDQTQKRKGFKLPEEITNGQRNDTIFRHACKLRSSGMERNEILQSVSAINASRCKEPLSHNELESIVSSACNYDEGEWDLNSHGKPTKRFTNLINFFETAQELNGLFRHNQFNGNIEYAKSSPWRDVKEGAVLSDTDLVFMRHHLSNKYKYEASIEEIQQGITIIANKNLFHPVRNYLDSLKWDGISRLHSWLTVSLGAPDTPYNQAFAIKTLVAAVARAYVPGIKFDHMLILEGNQGIGKSTLVSALAGDWFTELSLIDKDKDTVEYMRSAWIIEVSEMVCFKRQDIESIKAFISRRTDNVRLAYRKNSESFPRQSIFIGTINPAGDGSYLIDTTGNRRFWPVECTDQLNTNWLKENRDQLFAEAVVKFKAGEKLYIDDPKIKIMVENIQKVKQIDDVWARTICRAVETKYVTTTQEILSTILDIPVARITRSDQMRVATILKTLGFKKHKASDNTWEFRRDRKQINVIEDKNNQGWTT